MCREAIEKLDAQGRVHEIPDRDERLKEIAREYAAKPEGTLVVSPDNRIAQRNQSDYPPGNAGREARWTRRNISSECSSRGRRSPARTGSGPRNTNAGDVVRYTRGSKTHGIEAGEYARVERVNEKRKSGDGRSARTASR